MRARTLPDGTLVISYAAWLELFLFALYERSVFEVPPGDGRVTWSRVRLLRKGSGTMPYDALDAVAVETEYGPPYLHRLALVTSAGRVPLTSAYDDAHERVAALGRAIQAAVRPHHDLPIRT